MLQRDRGGRCDSARDCHCLTRSTVFNGTCGCPSSRPEKNICCHNTDMSLDESALRSFNLEDLHGLNSSADHPASDDVDARASSTDNDGHLAGRNDEPSSIPTFSIVSPSLRSSDAISSSPRSIASAPPVSASRSIARGR